MIMKLSLCLSSILFLFGSVGCGALGNYSQAMMGQPGAAAANGAPGTPGQTASGPSTVNPTEGAASAAASGPSTVSVEIRNSCGKTVRVFFGEKPKFGSGTYSTADSNSVSSHTFKPGDLFWIVDDSENGVASVSVKDATREIEITGDCHELAAR
jgi:hypothetical protein